jgi:aconitate hydratase
MHMTDSFSTRDVLEVNGKRYHYSSLVKLGQRFDL